MLSFKRIFFRIQRIAYRVLQTRSFIYLGTIRYRVLQSYNQQLKVSANHGGAQLPH